MGLHVDRLIVPHMLADGRIIRQHKPLSILNYAYQHRHAMQLMELLLHLPF